MKSYKTLRISSFLTALVSTLTFLLAFAGCSTPRIQPSAIPRVDPLPFDMLWVPPTDFVAPGQIWTVNGARQLFATSPDVNRIPDQFGSSQPQIEYTITLDTFLRLSTGETKKLKLTKSQAKIAAKSQVKILLKNTQEKFIETSYLSTPSKLSGLGKDYLVNLRESINNPDSHKIISAVTYATYLKITLANNASIRAQLELIKAANLGSMFSLSGEGGNTYTYEFNAKNGKPAAVWITFFKPDFKLKKSEARLPVAGKTLVLEKLTPEQYYQKFGWVGGDGIRLDGNASMTIVKANEKLSATYNGEINLIVNNYKGDWGAGQVHGTMAKPLSEPVNTGLSETDILVSAELLDSINNTLTESAPGLIDDTMRTMPIKDQAGQGFLVERWKATYHNGTNSYQIVLKPQKMKIEYFTKVPIK